MKNVTRQIHYSNINYNYIKGIIFFSYVDNGSQEINYKIMNFFLNFIPLKF